MKQFKAKLHSFAGGKLFRLSKKLAANWFITADVGRSRSATLFDCGGADGGKNQEQLVAMNWIVALQDVLVVGIPPSAALKRYVAAARCSIAITIVFGKTNAPAIAGFASILIALRF